MREILFQAKKLKPTNSGRASWAIGLPREVDFGKLVLDSFCNGVYEVNSETLCQYTGVCDSNGAQIFEHDVVQLTKHKYADKYLVVWSEDDCGFLLINLNSADKNNPTKVAMNKDMLTDAVVIGSIFDFEVEEN